MCLTFGSVCLHFLRRPSPERWHSNHTIELYIQLVILENRGWKAVWSIAIQDGIFSVGTESEASGDCLGIGKLILSWWYYSVAVADGECQSILYPIYTIIYNLYFHPLRNFPGPKIGERHVYAN